MAKILGAVISVCLFCFPVNAQPSQEFQRVLDALGLPEMLEIMAVEGRDYGQELGQEMLAEKAGSAWQSQVHEIYDIERNSDLVFGKLETLIAPENIPVVLAFFDSADGKDIIALEVAARRALLDSDLSDANDEHVAALRAGNDPRMEMLAQFIQVNDLLEINVTGALNSNYAFFSGLVDGGAYDQALTDEEILSEVWAQEQSIREDTEVWLYGFLSMAYTPLDDDQMRAYIEFSKSNAGQELNLALFEAFGLMFDQVSYALGRAVANAMNTEAL